MNFDPPSQPRESFASTNSPSLTPFDGIKSLKVEKLPDNCPECGKKIPHRFYKRKMQGSTIVIIVLSVVFSFLAAVFLPRPLSTMAFWGLLVATAGTAMRRRKFAHLRCISCGWSQKY